jgi:hypothetical protein
VKDICARFGVADEVWPDLTEHECGIDLPLDEARDKQGTFKEALEAVPEAEVEKNHCLKRSSNASPRARSSSSADRGG